jgi:hypothetical protein
MLDYKKINQSLKLCNPYQETEIEIKFSQYGQSFSSISYNQMQRLIKNINVSDKRLVTYYLNDHHRKIITTFKNKETIKTENYKTIDYIYNPDYQLHLYITQYNNDNNNNDYKLMKEKIEYHFPIQDYHLIFSETIIDENVFYEAVLRFDINLLNNDFLTDLDNVIKPILLLLNDTNVLYTEPQRLKLIHECNTCLNLKNNKYLENILIQPIAIELSDIEFDEPYIISTKSKGKRKMLIINEDGLWLVNAPYDYNLLTNIKNRMTEAWDLTIFDGEIIKPLNKNQYEFNYQYWYLIYDCLCFQNYDMRNKHYIERIDIAKTFNSILTTYINPNFLKTDLQTTRVALSKDEYIQSMKEILTLQEFINYDHNGLVFKPAHQGYNKAYKWTIPSMTTIDFAIYDSGNPESINLYVYDEKTKKDIPFQGNGLLPFDETMILHDPFVNEYKNKKYIAECRWDNIMEKMVFLKIRDDKNKPDSVEMAMENWKNINNNSCY